MSWLVVAVAIGIGCSIAVFDSRDANDDMLREVRLLGAALLQKPIRTEALAAILQQP